MGRGLAVVAADVDAACAGLIEGAGTGVLALVSVDEHGFLFLEIVDRLTATNMVASFGSYRQPRVRPIPDTPCAEFFRG